VSAIRASAPGKLMLAGEYAVLDGAPAVMTAVDRRAIARVAGAAELSPFLAAAAAQIAAARGDGPAARAARAIEVDSSALREAGDAGAKLGLGSSAAATVAAVACALAHEDAAPDRDEIHRLAAAAHGDVQAALGARGSGADVAASTYGGFLAFTAGTSRPLPAPAGLALVPFWTGAPADTVTLVAAVADARTAKPAAVGAALRAIGLSAEALVHAIEDGRPDLALAALAAGGRALAMLGQIAGVALEPACVAAARAALEPLGGTAKTCGAGGGDVAIAALPGFADLAVARDAIRAAGGTPLGISVGAPGVDILR
jgi:phosphomevalonate kinase